MYKRGLGLVVLLVSMLLSTGCCCHNHCGWRRCSPCCEPCCSSCCPTTCCHHGEPALAPPLVPPLGAPVIPVR